MYDWTHFHALMSYFKTYDKLTMYNGYKYQLLLNYFQNMLTIATGQDLKMLKWITSLIFWNFERVCILIGILRMRCTGLTSGFKK